MRSESTSAGCDSGGGGTPSSTQVAGAPVTPAGSRDVTPFPTPILTGSQIASPKKGYTWNGTVYRNRAKNHWFASWRWDSEHSWIRVGVPDDIQDKGEAISWFRKYVNARLEEADCRSFVLNPLRLLPKKVS